MGRHRLDEDDAERLAARLGSDVNVGAGEQGFLLLVADSPEERHGITKTLDGLANLRSVSSAGDQETGAWETLENPSDGSRENAQSLAGLVEAAEEHDDRTFIRPYPLLKGLRSAEGGRLHAVRDDDGVAAVVFDERTSSFLGDGDAHSDAFHVQAHGRRGNRARDRPPQGCMECSHEGGSRQHRGSHRDRGDHGFVHVDHVEVIVRQPASRSSKRPGLDRNVRHRSVERD